MTDGYLAELTTVEKDDDSPTSISRNNNLSNKELREALEIIVEVFKTKMTHSMLMLYISLYSQKRGQKIKLKHIGKIIKYFFK